jgi:hypothetical protein
MPAALNLALIADAGLSRPKGHLNLRQPYDRHVYYFFWLGFKAVVSPTGKSSLGWRIAHTCKLTAVVLIFQPSIYIALGELRCPPAGLVASHFTCLL